jgi:hypothetical protein
MKLRYLLVAALVGALCTVGVTAAVGHDQKKKRHPGTLFAVALGKNEISPTGERGVGDDDARGGFTAVIRDSDGPSSEFCWGYAAKDVDGTLTGAHVHVGDRNENGPVVIPLSASGDGTTTAASGCTSITDDLANAIKRHPRGYYFNLHSTVFPDGAIRGQLFGKRH